MKMTVNNSFSLIALKVYQLRWLLLTILLVLMAVITLINQKVQAITVTGETQWLNQKDLKSRVLQNLNNHWFTTSINEIKQTAEAVDWVDRVEVKRKWPSELEIEITEQQPIACWNQLALTNKSKLINVSQCKPHWLRVDAKKEFIKDYQLLTPELTKLEKILGQKLLGIEINERGTWKLHTDSELTIVAKNANIASRLGAWLKLIENGSLKDAEKFKKVDLRYPNGFSVKI